MRIAVLVLLAACGRVGFEATGDGGGGGGGSGDGGGSAKTDGGGADGAPAVCGDGVCGGSSGETCSTCAADCRTTTNVCGNATCGAGEDGTNCYVDCGPSPWTWEADEADLLAKINSARAVGVSCNGQPPTTAPAITMDSGLTAAAHDLAWEQARIGLFLTRCDGQSMLSYIGMVNANGSRLSSSSSDTTNEERMTTWRDDTNACMTLMQTSWTRAGVGIAVDASMGYVVLFR